MIDWLSHHWLKEASGRQARPLVEGGRFCRRGRVSIPRDRPALVGLKPLFAASTPDESRTGHRYLHTVYEHMPQRKAMGSSTRALAADTAVEARIGCDHIRPQREPEVWGVSMIE